MEIYEIRPMTREEAEAYEQYMLKAEANQRRLVYDLEQHKEVVC